MSRYEAAPWLGDLTGFQRRSVEHVIDQFYGPTNARRFLVADETGLGKTRVARGVIARAIETLQDSPALHGERSPRIDIVYVCANSDLARQNIRRLNVTGGAAIPFASRLTLLGEHSHRLERARGSGTPANLVSFTPGTSFDMGHSLGQSRERAMIALALATHYHLDKNHERGARRILQGGIKKPETFKDAVNGLRVELDSKGGIDKAILERLAALLEAPPAQGRIERDGEPRSEAPESLGDRVLAAIEQASCRDILPDAPRGTWPKLVRDLRAALATASVHTLEPDLIILDEFQRFRHLLSEGNPAGRLAHDLFQYEDAKVLLLSATPYKPFTLAGEAGEDHAKDLFRTLDFLARGRDHVEVDDIRTGLREFREAVLDNRPDEAIPGRLRQSLLKLMSRAERPAPPGSSMTVERVVEAADLRPADLAGYATLRQVGATVAHARDRGMVTAEYWKSAPYFLTFADGYQLGRRLRGAEPTNELRDLLGRSHHISGAALERFDELEPGNARMRVLTEDTLGQGWWQLLWMPPSLSYVEPSGPYAGDSARDITKRLVFSSWTATPSAVASILSYEAERRLAEGSEHYTAYTPEARKKIARRLQYTADADGKAKQMAVLLCFWPLPGLARATDLLPWVASNGGRPLTRAQAVERARQCVTERSVTADGDAEHQAAAQDKGWRAAFGWADSWPPAPDQAIAQALSGHRPEPEEDSAEPVEVGDIPNGLSHHIQAARSAAGSPPPTLDDESIQVLAEVGLHSPGNIAYRSMGRLARGSEKVTEWGVFEAAAVLANGLRSLFNRPDAIQLVERLGGDGHPYWRKVLDYIAMGNLEAVLDEYLHQLYVDRASGVATDALLIEVAREVAEALSLRSPSLQALDADDLSQNLGFVARFARRYGGRQQDSEDASQPEVRRAFNSPFWPFVLASTSVGQEGIDFHWWCHAVFHWNTPANPVDFEQREGRVDRYRGHAIRKNIADRHGATALAHAEGNPWDQLYALATDPQDDLGYSPGWVYPGPHRIERHVAPFRFSSDLGRYERMKRDVALYRLAFGQPRQEDLLEVLRRRGVDADPETLRSLRIDLAP